MLCGQPAGTSDLKWAVSDGLVVANKVCTLQAVLDETYMHCNTAPLSV